MSPEAQICSFFFKSRGVVGPEAAWGVASADTSRDTSSHSTAGTCSRKSRRTTNRTTSRTTAGRTTRTTHGATEDSGQDSGRDTAQDSGQYPRRDASERAAHDPCAGTPSHTSRHASPRPTSCSPLGPLVDFQCDLAGSPRRYLPETAAARRRRAAVGKENSDGGRSRGDVCSPLGTHESIHPQRRSATGFRFHPVLPGRRLRVLLARRTAESPIASKEMGKVEGLVEEVKCPQPGHGLII